MNAYASKYLQGADLAQLMKELCITPKQCAKFLKVTERTVFRWLADDSAPFAVFAVLAALWHETPKGQQVTACHMGNQLTIYARMPVEGLKIVELDSRHAFKVLPVGGH